MLIDWFTVFAQALNFFILVWLLKRFLYKPILDAIDAREKLIADELADAAQQRTAAQKEHEEFDSKSAKLDQQRSALMDTAREEAQAERQRLFDEARAAADALNTQRRAALDKDARTLNQAIRSRTQREVFAIARKTLFDLAGTELEQRVCEVFCAQLLALEGDDKATLAEAISTSAEPVLVRSAFDLPPAQQAAVREAVHQAFAVDIQLRFETKPALIAGIELSANGRNAAWEIADYLAALEQGIDEEMQAFTAPASKGSSTNRETPKETRDQATAQAGSAMTSA